MSTFNKRYTIPKPPSGDQSSGDVLVDFIGDTRWIRSETDLHQELPAGIVQATDSVCIVHPAPTESATGFQSIAEFQGQKSINADGVRLTNQSQVAVMQVADCATIVMRCRNTDTVVFGHAGQASLTPHGTCTCSTVISSMLRKLGFRFDQPLDDAVDVLITPHISAAKFRHEQVAERITALQSLHERAPEWGIIPDPTWMTLDLGQLIKYYLIEWYRLTPQQIVHDQLCTYETPGLSSRRADIVDRHNTVVVRWS